MPAEQNLRVDPVKLINRAPGRLEKGGGWLTAVATAKATERKTATKKTATENAPPPLRP